MPRTPLGRLRLTFLPLLALVTTFFIGAFASGKDTDETCAEAGQILDHVYRRQNWQEPSRIFPRHNKCNANYDMVPVWVNPALMVFALLTVVLLMAFIASVITRLRARPKASSIQP